MPTTISQGNAVSTGRIELSADESSAVLNVGTAVQLIDRIADNPIGTLGVIYAQEIDDDVYYCSVILANGHDIGAFTQTEMSVTFRVVGYTGLSYMFSGVTQLQRDYVSGLLDEGFLTN